MCDFSGNERYYQRREITDTGTGDIAGICQMLSVNYNIMADSFILLRSLPDKRTVRRHRRCAQTEVVKYLPVSANRSISPPWLYRCKPDPAKYLRDAPAVQWLPARRHSACRIRGKIAVPQHNRCRCFNIKQLCQFVLQFNHFRRRSAYTRDTVTPITGVCGITSCNPADSRRVFRRCRRRPRQHRILCLPVSAARFPWRTPHSRGTQHIEPPTGTIYASLSCIWLISACICASGSVRASHITQCVPNKSVSSLLPLFRKLAS